MRASTSCGAIYEEACASESRADFVHKMQIVLKEMRESRYWLRLIEKVGVFSENNLPSLLRVSDELVKIFTKSVITAERPIR
jgi:four helix bundle protein